MIDSPLRLAERRHRNLSLVDLNRSSRSTIFTILIVFLL